MTSLTYRLRAAAIHFVFSMLIAATAAVLVFGVWYPYPFREISGGRDLFLLLIAVDVTLGPLITLAVFDRAKRRRVLALDIAAIGALQVLALVYGMWTVFIARPVHLVFEFDRFVAVHAIEVPQELENKVSRGIDPRPVNGPTLLAVRPFSSPAEKLEMTLAALGGLPLSARPDLWQPYEEARRRVAEAARPIGDLRQRFPDQWAAVAAVLAKAGKEEDGVGFLPMIARKAAWTVLVDKRNADVLGFVALDSF